MNNIERKSNKLISKSTICLYNLEEDKLIKQAIETPFEKMITILNNVVSLLKQLNHEWIIQDVLWVKQRLEANDYYTYSQDETIPWNSKNIELKSFMESIAEYSEKKKVKIASSNDKTCLAFKPRNKEKFQTMIENSKALNIKESQIILKKKNSVMIKNLCSVNLSPMLETKNLRDKKTRGDRETYDLTLNNKKLPYEKQEQRELETDSPDFLRTTKKLKPTLKNCTLKEHLEGNLKQLDFETDKLSRSSKQSSAIINCNQSNSNYISDVKLPLIEEINKFLEYENLIRDTKFDILKFLKQQGRAESFGILAKFILADLKLLDIISVENLDNFLNSIREGYITTVPYHNEMHGIDVMNTVYNIITSQEDFTGTFKLTDIDPLILVIAALCHDIGHPGFNNNFHINSLSDYALTYNDSSILENFHASKSMKILVNPENNILDSLIQSDFTYFRKRFIQTILATDMSFHARTNSCIKMRIQMLEIKNGTNVDMYVNSQNEEFEIQQELFNFIIHAADIAHNSKPFAQSHEWTYMLCEEFWNQGDEEKRMNLPVSFLCNREEANVPKSQIGFM